MGAETHDWRSQLAGALEWWRDAGLDTFVEDAPRDWLARATPAGTAAAASPATIAEPVAEILPDTLDAFIEWRLGDTAPEAEWMSPRIAPSGPVDSGWVVLTDMPEADDENSLMNGAAGRLLDAMLAGIGLSRESVHLASMAVARPLGGQIPLDQADRLAELARHHLTLLKPNKLLLLGQATSRVLAETNGNAGEEGIRHVNLPHGTCVVAACRHPRFLMEAPAAKSQAWKQLLLLSRGNSDQA